MTTLLMLLGGILLLAYLSSRIDFAALKGQWGESVVDNILRRGLPAESYKVLRDVTIKVAGGTTQVDHVVVSPYGIFVIETKNFSGWIFGSERDAYWTQTFYGKRNQFLNPLRQNYAHLKGLEEALGLDASKFHSVIVLAGDAKIRTAMPAKVIQKDALLNYIKRKVDVLIAPGEVPVLLAKIEARRLAPGRETTEAHVASLKEKYQQAGGLLTDARKLVRQASVVLVAFKTFVAFAGVALILIGASMLISSLDNALDSGTKSKPQSGAISGSQSPSVEAGETVARQQSVLSAPSATLGFGNSALEKAQARAEARKQQLESEKQARWEASLFCAHSEDTGRCACYEPKGPKAQVTFEQCMALAQKSAGEAY